MRETVDQLGCTVLGELPAVFQPHGATCMLVLAESHLVVSTWPEHQLAYIDLFTCRADTDPEHAITPMWIRRMFGLWVSCWVGDGPVEWAWSRILLHLKAPPLSAARAIAAVGALLGRRSCVVSALSGVALFAVPPPPAFRVIRESWRQDPGIAAGQEPACHCEAENRLEKRS